MSHRTQSIVTRARDTNAKAARGRMSPPRCRDARRHGQKNNEHGLLTSYWTVFTEGWRLISELHSLFECLQRDWPAGVWRCYSNLKRFPSGRFELRACDLAGRMAYYTRFVARNASSGAFEFSWL